MIYNKKELTISEQIAQLQSRGLVIKDLPYTEYCLKTLGYYRLSGYWWSMQSDKKNHLFKPDSFFENVIRIYNFDSELRQIIFHILEIIEIAFRTKLIYNLSHELTPWWFEESNNFFNKDFFKTNLASIDRELDKTNEIFITDHKIKYKDDIRRPPAWKTLEVISFGTLSKLYSNLNNNIRSKKIIAKEFGTSNHVYLQSWLHGFAQIRNICAHHSRLWNRIIPFRPRLLPNPKNKWIKNVPPESEQDKLYIHICCMKYIFDSIVRDNDFGIKLNTLFTKYPGIDLFALGFKKNWLTEELWQI